MSYSTFDPDKIKKARIFQKQAAWAFDMAEYETALDLYIKAEQLYRQSYSSPGDRVFFMQASVIRCLEELTESGQVDLIPERQKKTTAFFKEWTIEKLRRQISRQRQREAMAFFAWRQSNFSTQFLFDNVTAAISACNYKYAFTILSQIVEFAKNSDDIEADALLSIANSKIELIAVKEEMAKPVHLHDLEKIAIAYDKAAQASQLPADSKSIQKPRINGFHYWFNSCAE